ncbi:LacI family DNA-binding transcriptional regulator [Sphingobium sp.]|uniref:LacI family DNA-binding transcriptional regulator n=1 Tax=Sphingobium sp. TaxID=1912891 RepID=UPI0026296439|nr:LacI family DNA-binding transcriptional regulator [Sphingobium sp.]
MVTIRDIAERAGVSVATVSRTLHAPEAVRPDKRSRVQQAIADLNYAPNAIARQLRKRRHETLIVIVPEIANPFFSGIIQSIENIAHDLGYRVLIGETQDRQDRLDHYADMVLSRAAGGLILLGSLLPSAVTASMADQRAIPFPLVLACERFEGLPCPSVAIDNQAAAALAVRHLWETGCRRIGTIAGPQSNSLGRDRLNGYRKALSDLGVNLECGWMEEGDFSIESGHAAMMRLLGSGGNLDGVFCANDEMAIGALQAIRSSGLTTPGDIALIGFDDLRFGAFATPPLTTIRQPTGELGETAMRMLDALLQGGVVDHRPVLLAHELVERQSTKQRVDN